MSWLPPAVAPVLLLVCSNVFMTFAWYGQILGVFHGIPEFSRHR